MNAFKTTIQRRATYRLIAISAIATILTAFGQIAAAAEAAPIVFNYPVSARPGDVIGIQGANFGSAPVVTLDQTTGLGGAPWSGTPLVLPLLNRVGAGWLSVRIPAYTGSNGLTLRISNGTQTMAQPILLNAARPYHLDTTQLVPNGAFRIFGRNLRLGAYMPKVTVDGLPAIVNLMASNEHMLVVTAPNGLTDNNATVVKVDNGNGLGATALDLKITTVTGASGDSLGLGVGWAAAFGPLLNNVIDVTNDPRLAKHMVCDGITDDSQALQAAMIYATRNGGATISLPTGTCFLQSGVQLLDKTILQGAGMDKTELTGEHIYGVRSDLFALRDLSLTDTGQSHENSQLTLGGNSRVALQRVRVNMPLARGTMVWMHSSKNIVISDSEFLQSRIGAGEAVNVTSNSGFVFTRNKTTFVNNTGADFGSVHNAYIANNTWIRDASSSALTDGHVSHTVTMDFISRVAFIGNKLDTVNGQVANDTNESEAMLTEGGGPFRTEGMGMVLASTPLSMTMENPNTGGLHPSVLSNGKLQRDVGVAIIAGKGAGQTRAITGYDDTTGIVQIDRAWDELPDTSSRFATAVWGIEKSLIKGNIITNSPRGIWFYHAAVRDVDIVGNSLINTGGIFVRSYQNRDGNFFSPQYNIRIQGNSVTNDATSPYQSYITAELAHENLQALGTSHIGIEVRGNSIVARRPDTGGVRNVGYIGGFQNRMSVWENEGDGKQYTNPGFPVVLGTIFQSNTCTTCDVGFHLGSGAYGTVIYGNVLRLSGALLLNELTAYSTSAGTSVGTFFRENFMR